MAGGVGVKGGIATLVLSIALSLPLPAVAQDLDLDHYQQIGEAAAQFDEIMHMLEERFWAGSPVDWKPLRTRRVEFLAAGSNAERARLINGILAGLHASNTRYFTKDELAYYELVDLLSDKFRSDLGKFFPGGQVSYVGIGAYTTEVAGRVFVSGLLEGFPADEAGVHIGDEILGVDREAYDPVSSFRGNEGKTVALTLRRSEGGPTEETSVVPVEIRPAASFAKAMETSARIIDVGKLHVAYVHMWCTFGDSYEKLLESLLAGKFADADALIWDLRGGRGGSLTRALDLFNPRQPSIDAVVRSGEKRPLQVKWTKPVAMLIDHGTSGAKEILAYGFKKYGIGEVIGSSTAKSVLAFDASLMRDGSLLVLAVSDLKIDGERLEGVGVAPTIEVDPPLPYRNGRDEQLERALAVLGAKAP